MSDTEDTKTIAQIKNEKKLKKPISEEAKIIRAENIKKAQQARKEQYEQRQKLKGIEHNINKVFEEDDNNEDVIILNKTKIKEPKNEQRETPQNIYNNNDLLNIINDMNKKINKIYTMKKIKSQTAKPVQPIQPIIIDDTKKNNLLESIKAKMYNQY